MSKAYRPGDVADALGVSVDTVRRWCDDGRLVSTRSATGHRSIDGADLANYLRDHGGHWEPSGVAQQSARNRLTGIVLRVERDKLTALVELQVGRFRMVSLLTRDAVDDLELVPGDLAVAIVKSTNVMIEVPR
jgi:molybdopterin-binding protein